MRYLIIGLGIYGTNLARDLASMGHEVIGCDRSESKVQAVKEFIATTYIVDSTDEEALGVLPLKGVDLVFVCIGEDFGASVKTVALLKKLDVKHIYARAIDELHYAILSCFHLDRIITPEQSAARHLAREMSIGTHLTTMTVTDTDFVANMPVPDYFVGLLYSDLKLADYGMTLIMASRPTPKTSIMGTEVKVRVPIDLKEPTASVRKGDVLTVLANNKALARLSAAAKA